MSTHSKPTAPGADLAPRMLSVLRMVAAFTFLFPGTMKLFGWPIAMPGGASAPPFSQIWVGGVLEVFGGALLLLGLCSRPVAFVLSGEMAVAYFQFHQPRGLWPIQNGGLDAVLFCFVWLYVAAAGPGPWSLDALLAKGRRRS